MDAIRTRQRAFNRWWRDHYRRLHIDRKPANERDRIRSMYQRGFFAGYDHVTQQSDAARTPPVLKENG